MFSKFASLFTSKYAYSVTAPVVSLFLLALVLSTGLFDRLENLCIDWRFQHRAPYDPVSDPRVLFVEIDQASLDQLGAWPWSRTVHGKFCQLLAGQNPSVIAFDIFFTEPGTLQGDADLANGASSVRAFISGADVIQDHREPDTSYGRTRPFPHVEGDISQLQGADAAVLPIPVLRNAGLFAFVNSEPSFDGVRRTLPMVVRVGHDVFPGLSLQALCQYWKVDPEQVRVRLGHSIELPTAEGIKSIPIDASGKMLLNYRNRASYPHSSYGNLLIWLLNREANPKPLGAQDPLLENKILLVGQSDPGLSDNGPSPLEPASPLPIVHLTALNNILRGDYLRIAPVAPAVVIWLLLAWITLFYLREKSIIFSIGIPVVVIFLYLLVAQYLFATKSLVVPVVWPIVFFAGLHLGSTAWRWLEEQQSKQKIKGVFASYIAPSVLNVLLENPENIRLGGVRKPVTIFFSDIRGFSRLSETMGEEELVFQLNEYFEKMVGCVNHHRGTLHKYIGDAIMAAWGDVISRKVEEDAANAVRTCLEMRIALVELNKEWAEQGRRQLQIGMGLNHGMVLVGNIGATQRREFTLIGDEVNLASRLEGMTKKFKTDLIVADSVYQLVRGQFLIRTLGVVQAVGMTRPVKIYEVLEDVAKPGGVWNPEWVALHEQGMDAFFARDFTAAKNHLAKCREQRPGDRCEQFIDLCDQLTLHPPGPDWNGVDVMESK